MGGFSQGNTKVREKKTLLMSLNAQQIPRGIVWDGTMVFSVSGRRLTS